MYFIVFLMWLLTLLMAAPLLLFIVELLVSQFVTSRKATSSTVRSAIIVPAHNEELGLRKTLENLSSTRSDLDEIIVIADNCEDSTFDIASSFDQVIALERFDKINRGKGFALAHGLAEVQKRNLQVDVIIVVDADCQISSNCISELKNLAHSKNRAVQAKYLMKAPEHSPAKTRIGEFAFLIKNYCRPKGLSALGAPVPLQGTGMAFPFEHLSVELLANGELVEDMKLGVDLVNAGVGAYYTDSCSVNSFFPSSEQGLKSQRDRWEHGHLATIQQFAVPGLVKSLKALNYKKALFFLDLFIPPFSLLLGLSFVLTAIQGLAALFLGTVLPFIVSLILLLTVLLSISLVWFRCGKNILSTSDILKIPLFFLSKFPVLGRFITRRQTDWVRTKRD